MTNRNYHIQSFYAHAFYHYYVVKQIVLDMLRESTRRKFTLVEGFQILKRVFKGMQFISLLRMQLFRTIETLINNVKECTNNVVVGMGFANLGQTKSSGPTRLGIRRPLLKKETWERKSCATWLFVSFCLKRHRERIPSPFPLELAMKRNGQKWFLYLVTAKD